MKTATRVSKRVSNIRLKKLADFLNTLPEERFDYSLVIREYGLGDPVVNAPTCGTTACAMGWAGSMEYFNRLGLRGTTRGEVVTDNSNWSFDAAAEIFGLTDDEAEYLFSPRTPLTNADGDIIKGFRAAPAESANAATVAKHIMNFIKHRGKLNEHSANTEASQS